LSDQLDIWQVV